MKNLMRFWIICSLYFFSSLSCCSVPDPPILIESFQSSLNEFFYSDLSSFIAERDHLLVFLDFPETLSLKLAPSNKIRLTPNDLTMVCLNHFHSISADLNLKDNSDPAQIREEISQFCSRFEASCQPVSITENKSEELLYPIDLNFDSYYKSSCNPTDAIIPSNLREILSHGFDDLIELSKHFLEKCHAHNIYHLFSDLLIFIEKLKKASNDAFEKLQCADINSHICFSAHILEIYIDQREVEIKKLNNYVIAKEFIKEMFCDKYEMIVFGIMDQIDYDYVEENGANESKLNWAIMAERFLVCKSAFFEFSSVPELISLSGLRIIETICDYCEQNHQTRIPFDMAQLYAHVEKRLLKFINLTDRHAKTMDINAMLEKFEYLISEAFKNEITPDNGQQVEYQFKLTSSKPVDSLEQMKSKIKEILVEFDKVTDSIAKNWAMLELIPIEGDGISDFFMKEILIFKNEIKKIARIECSHIFDFEDLMTKLNELIQIRLLTISSHFEVSLEIFMEFIQSNYEEDFFSKMKDLIDFNVEDPIKTGEITENTENKKSKPIPLEVCFDSPLEVLKQISTIPSGTKTKIDHIESLSEAYSNLIDNEFQEDGVNSILKEIVSNSINQILK